MPNALARGLLKSTLPVVGVIVHDITDPYFAEVVRGVEDAANRAATWSITCSSERSGERENSYVRLLRSMRAGGRHLRRQRPGRCRRSTRSWPGTSPPCARQAPPWCTSRRTLGEPEVGVDNVGGIAADDRRAGRDWGIDAIAFLAGPASLYVARERLAGYRRGLGAAGIDVDERLIVETGFDRGRRAAGVDVLLDGGVQFSAIAAPTTCSRWARCSGWQSCGVRRSGRRVGGRLRRHPVAALTAPSLSTVRLPLREMGRRGFECAIRLLAGEPVEPRSLPTEVVLRDSTAAMRGSA